MGLHTADFQQPASGLIGQCLPAGVIWGLKFMQLGGTSVISEATGGTADRLSSGLHDLKHVPFRIIDIDRSGAIPMQGQLAKLISGLALNGDMWWMLTGND